MECFEVILRMPPSPRTIRNLLCTSLWLHILRGRVPCAFYTVHSRLSFRFASRSLTTENALPFVSVGISLVHLCGFFVFVLEKKNLR